MQSVTAAHCGMTVILSPAEPSPVPRTRTADDQATAYHQAPSHGRGTVAGRVNVDATRVCASPYTHLVIMHVFA